MSTRHQSSHATSPGSPATTSAAESLNTPHVPRTECRRARSLGGGLALALAVVTVIAGCALPSESATDASDTDDNPAPVAESDAESESDTEAEGETETAEGSDSATSPDPTSAPVAEEASAEASAEEATDEEATDEEPSTEPVIVEPQHFAGTGSDVEMLDPLGESAFYAEVTHDGSSNFALWTVDENGQDIDLLVNDIGDYTGAVPINFAGDPSALRVEADGAWDIQFHPLHEAPRWDGAETYEADGDSIVIVDGVADGLTPVSLTHSGDSNFAIWAWGDDFRDLIVNEIGTYDGTTLLPDGSLLVQVTADGSWSLTKD